MGLLKGRIRNGRERYRPECWLSWSRKIQYVFGLYEADELHELETAFEDGEPAIWPRGDEDNDEQPSAQGMPSRFPRLVAVGDPAAIRSTTPSRSSSRVNRRLLASPTRKHGFPDHDAP